MGRGDKKTTRGKIFAGSYGKARPKKANSKKSNETKEKKDKE